MYDVNSVMKGGDIMSITNIIKGVIIGSLLIAAIGMAILIV
jgi:hypothetical protein